MRIAHSSLLITGLFFSTFLFGQPGESLITSNFLKMKMPVGTSRELNKATIQSRTSLLDSFIILKDYNLTKINAESFYTNMDSLKARLDKNKWTMRRVGATNYYFIQNTTSSHLAMVSTENGETAVAMKPCSVPSSAQPFAETNKIVAGDRINNTEFGRAVSISNNYAVVGVRIEDNDADGKNPIPDVGAAYVYERGADNKWKQVQKIVAADRSQGTNFGWSVGISGNTIVVGAIYDRKDATGRNESTAEGSAYVFERGSDGVWKQTQKLVSSAREGYNYFGTSVGIDGNIIVVGAPGHSRDSTERQEGYVGDAGAVFVFERRGNNWRRTYKLLANDRKFGGSMGNSVAISGNFVIAGAWAQDYGMNGENRMEAAGAAYIWERLDDGKWAIAQKLVASDRTPYDEFGYSVGISGDNAIVGARRVTFNRTDEYNLAYTGEAYIYSRNENGEWKEVQTVIPNDRKAEDYLGSSVAMSGDYALIGAHSADNKNPNEGAVYVYWQNRDGKWTQVQKLYASDEGSYAAFGGAVAIHKNFMISGAHIEWRDAMGKNELTNAGAAYIFMRGAQANKPVTKPSTKPAIKNPGKP
jgi:hypothetical protein